MYLQEIDPNNCYCMVMKKSELQDLIRCVQWFCENEADLSRQIKWKWLSDDLIEVLKQQQVD